MVAEAIARAPRSPRRAEEVADRALAYVLDASALLAMLQQEPGAELVEAVLEHSVMSAVNWAEVVERAASHGVETAGMRQEIVALGLGIVDFDAADAERAAALREFTRSAGLSLGDRACLATAQLFGITALTADRAWTELDLPVEVELLR